MPQYHFNIFDGRNSLDFEGTSLKDWKEARREAIHYAGEVLKENASQIAFNESWHMEVTDNVGLVLMRLDFNVMSTSATIGTLGW